MSDVVATSQHGQQQQQQQHGDSSLMNSNTLYSILLYFSLILLTQNCFDNVYLNENTIKNFNQNSKNSQNNVRRRRDISTWTTWRQ